VIDIENHNLQETLNQIIDELNNSDICESEDDGETTTVTSETTTPEPLPETCIIEDLAYLIDTSESMGKNESNSVWKPLALELLAQLKNSSATIGQYTLITYVDEVKDQLNTTSNDKMSEKVEELADRPIGDGGFTGQRELTFLGLKKALTKKEQNNFVVLFSDEVGDVDNVTKEEIIELRNSRDSKVFFLMKPRNKGKLDTMNTKFSDIGTVIDITDITKQQETIDIIIEELKASKICGENTKTLIDTNSTNTPLNAPGVNTGSQLSATCTSRMKVYFDGVEQTEQDNDQDPEMVSTFDIPEDTKVIAIECDNANSQDSGDILASTEDGLFTDSSWTCTSNNNIPDWTAADFEDLNGDFTEAIAISENSGPSIEDISEEAQFIWVDDDSDWAGCRLVL